ncbi:MAG: alpha/beta hydrolase [Intestinimonas sp.]
MALREEFSYPSSDGRHQIHALRWLPEESGPRAVVQLVHGISEHMGRYDSFASYLADHGFAVVGHDHLGHGKTARGCEYGFLGEQNGWTYLVHDAHTPGS